MYPVGGFSVAVANGFSDTKSEESPEQRQQVTTKDDKK
jgi:hypothetical protein